MSSEGIQGQAIQAGEYSKDMQEITAGKEDISNQASGHKANLSNPSELLFGAFPVTDILC